MGLMEQQIQDQFTFNRAVEQITECSNGIFRVIAGIMNGHGQNRQLCLNLIEAAYRVVVYQRKFVELQARSLGVGLELLAPVQTELEAAAVKKFEEVYQLQVTPEGKVEKKAVVVPGLVVPGND